MRTLHSLLERAWCRNLSEGLPLDVSIGRSAAPPNGRNGSLADRQLIAAFDPFLPLAREVTVGLRDEPRTRNGGRQPY